MQLLTASSPRAQPRPAMLIEQREELVNKLRAYCLRWHRAVNGQLRKPPPAEAHPLAAPLTVGLAPRPPTASVKKETAPVRRGPMRARDARHFFFPPLHLRMRCARACVAAVATIDRTRAFVTACYSQGVAAAAPADAVRDDAAAAAPALAHAQHVARYGRHGGWHGWRGRRHGYA